MTGIRDPRIAQIIILTTFGINLFAIPGNTSSAHCDALGLYVFRHGIYFWQEEGNHFSEKCNDNSS
jgi:hypothetical protein